MKLMATRAFSNSLASTPDLETKVALKVNEIGAKARSNPKEWTSDFRTIDSFVPARVFRMWVDDGGNRMIFALDGDELTLLDVSDHDIYDDWNRSSTRRNKAKQQNRYENRFPAPLQLQKKLDGIDDEAETIALVKPSIHEYSSRWLLHLDSEQDALKDELIYKFVFGDEEWSCHLVLGSAGTGKTSMLLALLLDLDDEGIVTSLSVPIGVEKALFASRLQLPNINADINQLKPQVVLIDDPLTPLALKDQLETLKRNNFTKTVVISIDPFQWSSSSALEMLQDLRYKFPMFKHELFVNYRQREKVAKGCVDVSRNMFKSVEEKFGTRYAGLLNNLKFSQEGGGVYKNNSGLAVEQAKEWIKVVALDPNSWTWTRPHLIVWYDGAERTELKGLFKGHRVVHVSEKDSALVRGMEFQTVLMFMPRGLPDLITANSEAVDWQRKSDFHTFISRAKDLVKLIEVF